MVSSSISPPTLSLPLGAGFLEESSPYGGHLPILSHERYHSTPSIDDSNSKVAQGMELKESNFKTGTRWTEQNLKAEG